jgi:hypothetical protein
MFPRDMVCLRNISVDTLHKGDTADDDDDDHHHNNKRNVYLPSLRMKVPDHVYVFGSLLLQ